MKIKSNSCRGFSVFLLLLSAHVIYAQGTRTREDRISILRADIRDLELARGELREDLRKVESRDESNRSRYIVIIGVGGFMTFGYALVPREVAERQIGLRVLLGSYTMEKALEVSRRLNENTSAFPQAATETLSEIESELSKKKRELEALEASELLAGLEPRTLDVSGEWKVEGRGNNGVNWSATLVLTGQKGGSYSGYFDWKATSGEYSGRERVTGTLNLTTKMLTLTGYGASGNIVSANYKVKVSPDGNALLNGEWTGSDGGGSWSATRFGKR